MGLSIVLCIISLAPHLGRLLHSSQAEAEVARVCTRVYVCVCVRKYAHVGCQLVSERGGK
jgi:hypothetical protein